MATSLQKAAPSDMPGMPGHDTVKPIDFTNAQNLLGARARRFWKARSFAAAWARACRIGDRILTASADLGVNRLSVDVSIF